MEIKDIKAVYFVGAGGIGMSAIARYFLSKKLVVAGYDKTPSNLTHELEKEGMLIHYEENVDLIPEACKDAKTTLVVYTPAIPAEHKELVFFHENGFTIEKRAQVLGTLTRTHKGLCVAGTHGKTSTSTMCAHIMHQSHIDCNAFLGGISKNYGTNYILSDKSDYVVIEADEFDRSFHWLRRLRRLHPLRQYSPAIRSLLLRHLHSLAIRSLHSRLSRAVGPIPVAIAMAAGIGVVL